MIVNFCYHSKKNGIAKISLGLRNFRYAIAKFTVPHPAATVPLAPAATIPFLHALKFFIPGLLKLIEDHMKLMEINPTLVMIGLT